LEAGSGKLGLLLVQASPRFRHSPPNLARVLAPATVGGTQQIVILVRYVKPKKTSTLSQKKEAEGRKTWPKRSGLPISSESGQKDRPIHLDLGSFQRVLTPQRDGDVQARKSEEDGPYQGENLT